MSEETLSQRASAVKLVVLDVDGVLTDGRIILGNYGDELKFFDVQDGFGLMLLNNVGIPTVIISAKKSKINHRRARDLKVAKLYQNAHDKLKVLKKVLRKFKVVESDVCFIGDDLIDLPVMTRVGFAVAVQNAATEVKERAHYVTQKKGGRGAVREAVDLILRQTGLWAKATEKYFK